MEIFSNPETMQSLSMGDKLLASCVTLLMGLGITFCVLLILWAFIALMGSFMKKADSAKVKKQEAAAPVAVATEAPAANLTNDAELTAVITAAIAAYTGGGVANNLVVRKISRLQGSATPWSNAGIDDCIESRRF